MNPSRSKSFRPAFEALEDRLVPSTINWVNRGAGDLFTAAERKVVDQAIKIWQGLIIDFDSNPTNEVSTFDVEIFGGSTSGMDVRDYCGDDPNALACETTNPQTGRASIYVGDNNDGHDINWFIDPTPADSSEFGTTIDAFARKGGPLFTYDMLLTVVHELGHALGFNEDEDAIGTHVDSSNHYSGAGSLSVSMADTVHVSDDAFPHDLMSPAQNFGERNLPSEMDLRLLANGAGLRVNLPAGSSLPVTHVILNNRTHVLTVLGDAQIINDTISLTRGSFGTRVTINGQVQTFDSSVTVSSIEVRSFSGFDVIKVGNSFSGTPISIDGGNDDDLVIGPDIANTWDVTGQGSGTLNGNITFTNVSYLRGGTSSDKFNLGGDFMAGLDGAGGTDSIVGPNLTNIWSVRGLGSGDLLVLDGQAVVGSSPPHFQGIENLVGGSAQDGFSLFEGGQLFGTIDGRDGVDLLNYSSYHGHFNEITGTRAGASVNLATGTATGFAGFTNIDDFVGTEDAIASDQLTGWDQNNTWTSDALFNDSGHVSFMNPFGSRVGTIDLITASFSGFETLKGGKLSDTFVLRPNPKMAVDLSGGDGIDTLDYSAFGADQGVAVDLGTGTSIRATGATAGATAGFRGHAYSFEDILGGQGDDLLRGTAGRNRLVGAAGNDILIGLAGADRLEGRDGNDLLIGGGGADQLLAGNGNDILIGGTTDYDNDDAALVELMKVWKTTSDSAYADNVRKLQTGISFSGRTVRLTTATVHEDYVRDVLTGDDANNSDHKLDWFFGQTTEFTDLLSGQERVN